MWLCAAAAELHKVRAAAGNGMAPHVKTRLWSFTAGSMDCYGRRPDTCGGSGHGMTSGSGLWPDGDGVDMSNVMLDY